MQPDCKDRVEGLIDALTTMQNRDPDQDIRDVAVPAFDAMLVATLNRTGDNQTTRAPNVSDLERDCLLETSAGPTV